MYFLWFEVVFSVFCTELESITMDGEDNNQDWNSLCVCECVLFLNP